MRNFTICVSALVKRYPGVDTNKHVLNTVIYMYTNYKFNLYCNLGSQECNKYLSDFDAFIYSMIGSDKHYDIQCV